MKFLTLVRPLALLNIIYLFGMIIVILTSHTIKNFLGAGSSEPLVVASLISLTIFCFCCLAFSCIVWILNLNSAYSVLFINTLACILITAAIIPMVSIGRSYPSDFLPGYELFFWGGVVIGVYSLITLFLPVSKRWLQDTNRPWYFIFHPQAVLFLVLLIALSSYLFLSSLASAKVCAKQYAIEQDQMAREQAYAEAHPEPSSDESEESVDNTMDQPLEESELVQFYEHLYSRDFLVDSKDPQAGNIANCFAVEVKPKEEDVTISTITNSSLQFDGLELGMYSCGLNSLETLIIYSSDNWYSLNTERHRVSRHEGYEDAIYESFVNKLLPINLFVKSSDSNFRHVNPEAIEWITANLIPDPQTKIKGVAAQDIYTHVFRGLFRALAVYHNYLMNTRNLSLEQENYTKAYKDNNGYEWLESRYADVNLSEKIIESSNEASVDQTLIIGFWLRRSLDDSADSVWLAVSKVMQVYDSVWWHTLQSNQYK